MLSVNDLRQRPTLKDVIELIRINKSPDAASLPATGAAALAAAGAVPHAIPRAPSKPPYPLSAGQHALYIMQQRQPESAAYNVAFAFRLRGKLSHTSLQKALDTVTRLHPQLRCRFSEDAQGRPVQRVDGSGVVPLLKLKSGYTGYQSILNDLVNRPFDLGGGEGQDGGGELPTRCATIKLHKESYILLLTFHHIATDGLSSNTVFRC